MLLGTSGCAGAVIGAHWELSRFHGACVTLPVGTVCAMPYFSIASVLLGMLTMQNGPRTLH